MGLIVVTGHFERPQVKKIAQKAKKLLHNLGADCTVSSIRGKRFKNKAAKTIVAIGGDGTLLRVMRGLKYARPVLGIAAGTRCALMQVKPEHMETALKKIVRGTARTEKRMRLASKADGKRLPNALNEVMLVNRESGGLTRFLLKVNGRKKGIVEADGLIISTPTGSTGHSYSAGGKRISIGSNVIAIVPSNHVNRSMQPLYVMGNSIIELSGFKKREKYQVVLDGRHRRNVSKRLVVKRGKDALFLT